MYIYIEREREREYNIIYKIYAKHKHIKIPCRIYLFVYIVLEDEIVLNK